ncbi:methyl-accepting chemotaxis protein [Chitinimonas sp. BJB300]|uniref:methyl-accepting chemotaxis protein n=1 Tax=Chitinimonas sp. BJB300 TaxID=1559339 RepID=UPI000C10B255|nr:methyl-accepting chemotaxis protein [Chitinimonas sp. BJB300]PHV12852.1 chemotaxis protein [Chitinimonas sp. BJB300]TSJ86116.1 methyl-accepting chemotaxis protein [Chitinimonas sp. BJB300]
MTWLLNLRTHTKLMLAFSLVIIGFASLLYLAQTSLRTIQKNDENLNQLGRDLAAFKDFRFNIQYTREKILIALQSKNAAEGNVIATHIRSIQEQNSKILTTLLAHAAKDQAQYKLVNEVTRLWRDYTVVRDQQVQLLTANKFDEALTLAMSTQHNRIQHLRELAYQLDTEVAQKIRLLVQNNNQIIDQQLDRALWLGSVLILLTFTLTIMLSRSIGIPLLTLTNYAKQICVGDIPTRFDFTLRRDEVGELSQAFARMGEYLKTLSRQAERLAEGDLSASVAAQSEQDVLGLSFARMVESLCQLTQEMQEGIVVIASASEEIFSTAGKVASSVHESAASITEIATTIEEVKQTAHLAHKRASEVNEASTRNRQIAFSGCDAVAQSLSTMAQIREQMHAMAESILRLGEQSQAISEIVATVNELAEQSNLLGVNASIEAGKAGDAGKGFAVVALEVKALAEQSKLATAQVRNILGDVQRAMTRAAMAAEQGSKAVDLGFEHARSSDEAMRQLAESLEQSSDMAQQIATTSQQQLAGMDQVAMAINNLRQTSHDNAAGANQVGQSTRDLHGLGGRLKRLASQFKLPSRQTA